jgi:predicted extracellular nuclease
MNKFLLSLTALLFLSIASFGQCSDLFISEYVEGSGNNKALEIYNPTNAAIRSEERL